jgi:hypothetical protein
VFVVEVEGCLMATLVGLVGFPAGTSAVATPCVQCPGGLGFPGRGAPAGGAGRAAGPETAQAAGEAPQRRLVEAREAAAVGGQVQRLAGNPRRSHRPAASARRVVPRSAPALVVGRR